MNQAQQTVRDWMTQFGQETPAQPGIPSKEICELRAKLELEECLELLVEGLGVTTISFPHREPLDNFFETHDSKLKTQDSPHIIRDSISLKKLLEIIRRKTTRFEQDAVPNLEKIADGCSDKHVINLGTENACGLNSTLNFEEVMRSNFTKLWKASETSQMPEGCTGRAVRSGGMEDRCILVKDAMGKVIKSPSYSPPKFNL